MAACQIWFNDQKIAEGLLAHVLNVTMATAHAGKVFALYDEAGVWVANVSNGKVVV